MSGEFSDAGAVAALNAVFLSGNLIGLCDSGLTITDTTTVGSLSGHELSDANYARLSTAWTVTGVSGAQQAANNSVLTFGGSTGFAVAPATAHQAFMLNSGGTSILYYWILDFDKTAAAGDKIEFAAGALVGTLD